MSLLAAMGAAVEEVEHQIANRHDGVPSPFGMGSAKDLEKGNKKKKKKKKGLEMKMEKEKETVPAPAPASAQTQNQNPKTVVVGSMNYTNDSESDSDSSSDGEKVPSAPIIYSSDENEIEFDLSTSVGKEAKTKYDASQAHKKQAKALFRHQKEAEAKEFLKAKKTISSNQTHKSSSSSSSSNPTTATTATTTRSAGLGSLSGMGFGDPEKSTQINSSGKLSSSSNSADSDDFGITYKPVKKSYALPSGPAFADEKEFENDLDEAALTSGAIHSNNDNDDDDDEFDFVEDDGDGKPSITDLEPLSKSVLSSSSTPSQEQIINDLKAEVRAEQLRNEGSDIKTTNVLEAGQHALNTIQGKIGFSDDDLQQIDDSTRPHADSDGSFVSLISKDKRKNSVVSMVITEDEEEDDEEEEEEEEEGEEEDKEKEDEQKTPEQKAADRLQSEWGEVEAQSNKIMANTTDPNTTLGVDNKPISIIDEKSKNIKAAEFFNFAAQTVAESLANEPNYTSTIVPVELDLPSKKNGLFNKLFGSLFCFASPQLTVGGEGNKKRDLMFYVANIKYNCGVVEHKRLLQTIYKKFTGNTKMYVSDQGAHWNLIGFQGLDPCTDLNRSMGILSLYLTLSMIENHSQFAAKAFRNSQREGDSWPFMCVAVGFTLECIKALRRGDLYAHANKSNSVLQAMEDLFVGLFLEFFSRTHMETEVHHAVHLSGVKRDCEKSCLGLLKKATEFFAKGASGGTVVNNFVSVEDEENNESNEGGGGGGGHSKSKKYGV